MGKRFEDLKVWKLAREFRGFIYDITERFPKREDYVLTSQIRKAALSISSNIAEGYGRYYYKENIQFCRIARGSLNEVIDQLYAALDEKYIDRKIFEKGYDSARELERVLNGYIGYLKKQQKKPTEKE